MAYALLIVPRVLQVFPCHLPWFNYNNIITPKYYLRNYLSCHVIRLLPASSLFGSNHLLSFSYSNTLNVNSSFRVRHGQHSKFCEGHKYILNFKSLLIIIKINFASDRSFLSVWSYIKWNVIIPATLTIQLTRR